MLQRANRGAIKPISIGRALLAELDSQFLNLESGNVINSQYVIAINGGDAARFSSYESAMLTELHQAVVNHAAIEGYALSGEAVVSLVTDPAVKRGTCRVTPVLAPAPVTQTAMPATPPPASAASAAVVLADGQRIILDRELITVGRQSDCEVVIDDHNVSRRHAEIRRTAAGWVITDRGSTNGTKINGEKIVNGQLLTDGDDVAFGSANTRFENS